ncbi:type VI secretion system tube protein Hcp [Aliikangiella coralliicola]|uniref:Type VI secretion system tube protein Hcp n=1 Tax=Aliikangiella coralliicola TaxID=2592383 RepID=A0A545U8U2_9GAMM|nr:type VI secretion system tube protein Hcp [Aliikangiella coralliicola]TQV85891.1 type VI secretion system tube protein Hcp [Aliikangiella coralliicola]
MAIYVEYDGMKGNVTAEGYENHLQVESCSFGVQRNLTMEPGKMANREVGKPHITEVCLTRVSDNSATALFKESVSGSSGKKVTIKFVRTGTDKVEEFMQYALSDCLVSGYEVSCQGDGDPHETITLSFSKCEINYTDYDNSNKSGSPQRSGYDLKAAKAL